MMHLAPSANNTYRRSCWQFPNRVPSKLQIGDPSPDNTNDSFHSCKVTISSCKSMWLIIFDQSTTIHLLILGTVQVFLIKLQHLTLGGLQKIIHRASWKQPRLEGNKQDRVTYCVLTPNHGNEGRVMIEVDD